MRIALVSLNQIWEDKAANRDQAEMYFSKALLAESQLIIFPEMTLTGFTMNVNQMAEPEFNSETMSFFQKLANGMMVVAFGVLVEARGTFLNRMVVVGDGTGPMASYNKIHLFSYAKEDMFFSAGSGVSTFETCGSRFGCSICYDLRFPALFQRMASDTDVVVTIANWPAERVRQWYALLRARAIENQVYVVGVNRTGVDGNGLSYRRSSIVYDPFGEKVTPLYSDGELDLVDIDPHRSKDAKDKMSILSDRRNNLYAMWYEDTGLQGKVDRKMS